ncbi:glycosyltransferase family 4 protein [candidate division WOR-3 bacterium]|nr:glycosyltransferase family 4 protein [candidate division WOR-3 bacterium]
MKVLIVSHSCIIDVNQKYLIELAKYPKLKIGLIVPSIFRDDTLRVIRFKKHPKLCIKTYALPPLLSNIPNLNINLHFYPVYREVIKNFKPDIIHIEEEPYSLSAFQFTLARGASKSLFFTEQNIYKKYPFPFNKFENYVYHQSCCATAVSENAKDVLLRKEYSKKIFLTPHGVDLKIFHKRAVNSLKADLHLKGFIIGYIGRLTPEKGVEILIKAASKLRNISKTAFSLLIIGSGIQKHRIRNLVNNSGLKERTRIIIGGIPHSLVPEYLNCMDVLVLPSLTMKNWKEQFGRVLIEALACEVPIIGSDSGEIPHIIKKTEGGLIFSEDNAESLSHAIMTLIKSPKQGKELARKGEKIVTEYYSFKAVAERFYKIYEYVSNSTKTF